MVRKNSVLCALLLTACGGGGSGGGSTPSLPSEKSLPPLTSIRSDFITDEGSITNPLKVDGCNRTWLLPLIIWQQPPVRVCNFPATVYPQTNFIPGPAHDVWRLAVNNEPSWDGDAGPPNQSAPLDGKPFAMSSTANSITLKLDLANSRDNGGKLPYLGFNYLRGVQGDTVRYFSKWGVKPQLSFTGSLQTNGDTHWVQLWFFFRDAEGKQYMVRHDMLSPQFDKTSGEVNWNWPAINSYYYPGAKIIRLVDDGGAVFTGNGTYQFAFDVEAIALKVQPQFATLKPDFLGIELAIEQGYIAPSEARLTMQATFSNIKLTGFSGN